MEEKEVDVVGYGIEGKEAKEDDAVGPGYQSSLGANVDSKASDQRNGDPSGKLTKQEQAKKWGENPSPVPFCHFVALGKEIEKRRFYYFNQWRLLPGPDESLRRAIPPPTLPPDFCRFREVDLYDHNRVKVPPRADEPEYGDYYDASHITCGTVPYIACEAPTQKSLTAFWNMVWAHKVRIIVMLSDSVKGKNVFVYWPMKNKGYNSLVKNELTLRLVKLSESTNTFKVAAPGEEGTTEVSIVERKMEMWEQSDPNKKHFVVHLQFAGWPEDGNPLAEGLNTFLEQYRNTKQILEPKQSVLVHCSNGIGKTGAFLALDTIVDQIVKGDLQTPINVFQVVSQLRKDRAMMVQTDEQYAFIHKFIEHRWSSGLGPVPLLMRQPTAQQFRAAGVLNEYEVYRAFLQRSPIFLARTKLVRLVKDHLSVVLKAAYAHRLKSVLYYTWRGLIKALLDLFDRDTKWNLEFVFALADRGSLTTLTSLTQYVQSAVILWEKTDVTEEDSWVSLHTVELDIYCCCRDMLEQTKLLTPRNRPEEQEERSYLLLENRLDRLFWYRFFLRRSEVPIAEFGKALRIYLEVGPHAESISLSDAQFIHMFTMSLATPQDSKPTQVTPKSFYTFLNRYGQLGTIYTRMKAMCLSNGELAPWFRPELSREQMETVNDFPIRGFNFLVRLSTDNMTFVLHCDGPEGERSKKKPPLKVHRDSKGYYWEAIALTNQRLNDMRSLLYKYVLEVKTTYREDRSAIDTEMKEWDDQETNYNMTKQFEAESWKPLARLATLFSSRLFQDEYFDNFYNEFKPNPDNVEKMFSYIDKDKNTTLDAHEIRVGLLLLFSPLLEDLSQMVHRLIRKDIPRWGSKTLQNELRNLSTKVIEWLPMPGSQLFSVEQLEGEISRVAAKLCSHTMELVTACQEFKRIGYKMDMAEVVADSLGGGFSSRFQEFAGGAPPQPPIETEEIELTSADAFKITVSPSPAHSTTEPPALGVVADAMVGRLSSGGEDRRDSSKMSMNSSAKKDSKAGVATLIKAWQLRRRIKARLAKSFLTWMDVLLEQVTTDMGYKPPVQHSELEGYLVLFVETAFLPTTLAVYMYYYDSRVGIKTEIEVEGKKNDYKTVLEQLLQFIRAITFIVFWSFIYYSPWYAWAEVARGVIVLNGGPFHWIELSLPFILLILNLLIVVISTTLQKKATEFELKWQVASLSIRQSEAKFRQMSSAENLVKCQNICVNGKEGIHHVMCPVFLETRQPWDCLRAISEDFLTNYEGNKNATPLQSERYFRFVKKYVRSRLGFKALTEFLARKLRALRDPKDYSPEARQATVNAVEAGFFFLICIGGSFVHAILPGVHRTLKGYNFFGGGSLPEVLSTIFLALGTFFQTAMMLMLIFGAIAHYQDVRRVLKRVLDLSNAARSFMFHRWPRYLALDDHPNNLLFFTKVRDHAKERVDASVLTAVSVALIVNVAIIARLVAVEIGRIPSTAILNVMNIFEALILSLLIIVLFNIVVDLNTQVFVATTTVLQSLHLGLSRRLMEMEETRAKELSRKVTLVYDQKYTPVLEIQKYDQMGGQVRPALFRERSMAFNEEPKEETLKENKGFRHPKDAKEEEFQRQREKRMRGKQEDDIREMDAFATLVGSSVDNVRCAELPIEILGLSVDKTFRTRVLAAIAAGVVSVLLQVISSRTSNDALQL